MLDFDLLAVGGPRSAVLAIDLDAAQSVPGPFSEARFEFNGSAQTQRIGALPLIYSRSDGVRLA